MPGESGQPMDQYDFAEHVVSAIELVNQRIEQMLDAGQLEAAQHARAIARIAASLSALAKRAESDLRAAHDRPAEREREQALDR